MCYLKCQFLCYVLVTLLVSRSSPTTSLSSLSSLLRPSNPYCPTFSKKSRIKISKQHVTFQSLDWFEVYRNIWLKSNRRRGKELEIGKLPYFLSVFFLVCAFFFIYSTLYRKLAPTKQQQQQQQNKTNKERGEIVAHHSIYFWQIFLSFEMDRRLSDYTSK